MVHCNPDDLSIILLAKTTRTPREQLVTLIDPVKIPPSGRWAVSGPLPPSQHPIHWQRLAMAPNILKISHHSDRNGQKAIITYENYIVFPVFSSRTITALGEWKISKIAILQASDHNTELRQLWCTSHLLAQKSLRTLNIRHWKMEFAISDHFHLAISFFNCNFMIRSMWIYL